MLKFSFILYCLNKQGEIEPRKTRCSNIVENIRIIHGSAPAYLNEADLLRTQNFRKEFIAMTVKKSNCSSA